VRDLVSRDVKAPYLKSLQGHLWREGYAAGELRAPLFADVAPALSAWRARGLSIAIYSSGSVEAQKLFFAHTDHGDLSSPISAWFDTVNAGPKTDAESYRRIVAEMLLGTGGGGMIMPNSGGGGTPEEREAAAAAGVLFLSDNVKEVDAAIEAGLQSVVVRRPGNAPLSEEDVARHRVIESFEELGLAGEPHQQTLSEPL